MAKKIHYADDYQPRFGLPYREPASPEEMRAMPEAKLRQYMERRQMQEIESAKNPVGWGWTLPVWEQVFDQWKNYNVHVVLGGNQCVRGDTSIYDPVEKEHVVISEARRWFHVLAWNGTTLVPTAASTPFVKAREAMIELRLSDDRVLNCTAGHRVMLMDGSWVGAGTLNAGDQLLSPWALDGSMSITVQRVTPGGVEDVWDITVPEFGNYWCAGVINHNSSKTMLGARMSVWAACEIPEAEVYNFHISEKRSIDDQQRFIYENLPDWLKNMPTKKGIAHSLQYTQKNGFTDGIAIMPPVKGYRRGGSIKFYNYAQFVANDQIIEGIKAHFVWADEKIPFDLFETIRMGRLGTYHGRMLLSYTVVDGWNSTIEKILARTRTLKTRYCDHPKIMANLPIMQESLSVGSCCIHYAWTQDNPFADYREFMRLYGSESREVILARAFGVPTKSTTSAFPLFSKEYVKDGGNVIKHEDLPWLKTRKNAKGQDVPYPVTFYMALDPAGSKAWFMVWVAIDAANTWWVYRESPENEEWALPGNKPGPATTPRIHGIKAYVEHITTAESGPDLDKNIYERIIDPRMGAAERQSQDGATTIISELDDAGLTFIPAPAASSEANKGEIEDGIQLINNLLAYKTDQPVDALNRPRLYVSDRCQNLIYALQEYTGKLGATEATKDPIDCYDAETEILTTDGWVPFPSLPRGVAVATMAKDGTLEYQVPTEYHERHYTGPMVLVNNGGIDLMVTPNHRVLVLGSDGPWFKLAKDLRAVERYPRPVESHNVWRGVMWDKASEPYQSQYSGMVYCVTVPNGTLVVRRNSKSMVCGNCLRYLRKANCEFVPYVKDTGGRTGVY